MASGGNGKPHIACFDTSALTKLVIAEPESRALTSDLNRWQYHVASEIVLVELLRVAQRAQPRVEDRALELVRRLSLVPVTRSILLLAGRLAPSTLRSLDAIHLASALALGTQHITLVTYDHRLASAARDAGMAVDAPS